MPEARLGVPVVEVKIADTEMFRTLAGRMAAAAESFAKLSDEERAALPSAARDGIAALAGASAQERPEPAEPRPDYYGYVILEWPAPAKSAVSPQAMVTWKVTIRDAADGSFINTVEALTVRADVNDWVAADMTMLAKPDGMPLLNADTEGVVYPDGDGGFLKGTFPFLVTEMRIRS